MPADKNKKIFNYKSNQAWAENLQIIMQIGLTMAGCIMFCFYVGYKLDRWVGTKGIFTVIFLIFGVVGGGIVVYRQIMDVIDVKKDNGISDDEYIAKLSGEQEQSVTHREQQIQQTDDEPNHKRNKNK